MKKGFRIMMISLCLFASALFVIPNITRANTNITFEADIAKDKNQSTMARFTITQEATGTTHGQVTLTKLIDEKYNLEISIPNTVEYNQQTYDVIAIGDNAFANAFYLKNTGLKDNHSVTSIGTFAYARCHALLTTELESNSRVTSIGDYAFYQCYELQSTGLENNQSVTTIGSDAFASTPNLLSTGLANNATVTFIGEYAFLDCHSLTSTGLETNTSVTTIQRGAFLGCENIIESSLAADSKITYIPERTFSNMHLKSFIFKSVRLPQVAPNAFLDTTLYYLNSAENSAGLASYTNKIPYELSGLSIQQMPYKTTYIEHETFDASGLVLSEDFATLDGTFLFHDEIDLMHLLQNGGTLDKSILQLNDHFVNVSYLQHTLQIPIQVLSAPQQPDDNNGSVDNPTGGTQKPTPPNHDTTITPNKPVESTPAKPSTQPTNDAIIKPSLAPNTSDTSDMTIWVQIISVAALVGIVILLKKKQK